MTLEQLAAHSGVAADKIVAYTNAGLLPCKDVNAHFSADDEYWLDMVNCFLENGSSVEELKDLMPLCEQCAAQ
ncbi:helix-turn-helix domain-containing protein [Lactiplantibacillus plantarum]|uniref:helix-turn-helix domain-containing protein n=1 Tax=Lactiplantibacillus plantarum TaxID=1590 RepID=UPI001455FECD|nr:helix-turn-helix domain-containing protein [Lactiplantibacillus plantarum]NLS61207.1 MerR family transcriptional regulator [Lactiplantibacillus plantarum]